MKKFVLVGLLAGLIMLVASVIISQLFNIVAPFLTKEYANTEIFRSTNDPLMLLFYLYPLLLGVVLAWIWSKVKDLLGGETWLISGLKFGLIYWLVTLPALVMTYSTLQVSLFMVISWTFAILVQSLLAGLVYAKMLGSTDNKKHEIL